MSCWIPRPVPFIVLPVVLLAACGPGATGGTAPGVIPFSMDPTKVLPSSPELLTLGKKTFEKQCVACHGVTGRIGNAAWTTS